MPYHGGEVGEKSPQKYLVYFVLGIDGEFIAITPVQRSFDLDDIGVFGQLVKASGRLKGRKLHIASDVVDHPKAVRFDWSNNPKYYLINKAELPASLFVLELD